MLAQDDIDIATRAELERAADARVSRRSALLDDLKPTLLVVTAVVVVAVIAVVVSLIAYSPGPAGDVSVSETDYRISMPTTLPAGSHTVALTNNGKVDHELLLFRTDLAANALPTDKDGNVNEDSPLLHGALDSGAGLKAGGTQSLPVKLQPGHYVAACNLPGHYRLGMRLDITVGG